MPISITELQAREAAITMWGAIILLSVLTVCATILVALALYRYHRDQEQSHVEHMASIEASREMGKTAWAQTDVNKSRIIREQAKRIAELEGWKARTVKRMKELNMADQVWGKGSNA